MLTYDFECGGCEKVFEQRHSIHDVPKKVKCPHCGKKAKRCIGTGSTVDTRVMDGMYPYPSDRLPRGLGANLPIDKGGAKYTPAGKPIMLSRRHEDRYFKTHNYVRE